MFTLHALCQSGNAFKVAFMLNALGVPWQAKFVDLFNGETRSPAWREAVNPMGEVPVLEDGERRLTQSGAILVELAERHGRFGGRDDAERYEILRWLLFDNHKFTASFASYRFQKSFSPTPPDPAVMAWLRGRFEGAFAVVDQHLATRDWMVGDGPTIADFSLSGYLFYPVEESGYDVAERHPALGAWVQRLRGVPGWADPYELLPGPRIAPRW